MKGSAFIASLPAGPTPEREQRIVDAVRSGIALPIVWKPVRSSVWGKSGIFFVSSDTLRFGEPGPNDNPDDWDWVRIGVSATTAQQIADSLGVLLPTDRIVDLTHAQAGVTLVPHTQPFASTTASMLAHHRAIETERSGRDGLISTVGKEWILGNELFRHPLGKDGAINYGWHAPKPARKGGPFNGRGGTVVWQQRGQRHNRFHADYSQWVPRLVHPRMIVDDAEMATAEVMQSAALAPLVSYDGPLKATRHTAVAPLDPIQTPPPLSEIYPEFQPAANPAIA